MESKNYPLNEGYLVYSDGRIKSLKGKFLKYQKHPQGYLYVKMDRKTCKVHRIIALTFIPNPNNYSDVNHIDGNKENNYVSNLDWCNDSMNIKHAFKIGLKTHFGESNPRNIIPKKDITDIRIQISNGGIIKEIAKKYGVHKNTIYQIKYNKNWVNI